MEQPKRLTEEELKTIKDLKDPIMLKLISHINVLDKDLENAEEELEEKNDKIYELEEQVDSLEWDIRQLNRDIDNLDNKLDNSISLNGYNTLPYAYVVETLEEVLKKRNPQEIENVLKLLL